MPTYSYRCPKCGHQYDKFQKINDSSRARCPKCHALGERQITGGAGIVFKGSGFYETDYRSDSYKKAAKAETGGTTAKAAEKGQETKPGVQSQTKAKESKKKTA